MGGPPPADTSVGDEIVQDSFNLPWCFPTIAQHQDISGISRQILHLRFLQFFIEIVLHSKIGCRWKSQRHLEKLRKELICVSVGAVAARRGKKPAFNVGQNRLLVARDYIYASRFVEKSLYNSYDLNTGLSSTSVQIIENEN